MGKFTYNIMLYLTCDMQNINICEIDLRLIYMHMQHNYVDKHFMYLHTQDIDVQIT